MPGSLSSVADKAPSTLDQPVKEDRLVKEADPTKLGKYEPVAESADTPVASSVTAPHLYTAVSKPDAAALAPEKAVSAPDTTAREHEPSAAEKRATLVTQLHQLDDDGLKALFALSVDTTKLSPEIANARQEMFVDVCKTYQELGALSYAKPHHVPSPEKFLSDLTQFARNPGPRLNEQSDGDTLMYHFIGDYKMPRYTPDIQRHVERLYSSNDGRTSVKPLNLLMYAEAYGVLPVDTDPMPFRGGSPVLEGYIRNLRPLTKIDVLSEQRIGELSAIIEGIGKDPAMNAKRGFFKTKLGGLIQKASSLKPAYQAPKLDEIVRKMKAAIDVDPTCAHQLANDLLDVLTQALKKST